MSAVIGTRWKPGEVVRTDSATGFYEHINSVMNNESERLIQRLLLAKERNTIHTRPGWLARVARAVRAILKGKK